MQHGNVLVEKIGPLGNQGMANGMILEWISETEWSSVVGPVSYLGGAVFKT
jgi:hypothetical protein